MTVSDSQGFISGVDPAPADEVVGLHTPTDCCREDYRFAGPVKECLCGSNMFHVVASFDEEGEVSFYVLDGMCWSCGSIVTLPCPLEPGAMTGPHEVGMDDAGDDTGEW